MRYGVAWRGVFVEHQVSLDIWNNDDDQLTRFAASLSASLTDGADVERKKEILALSVDRHITL